MGGATASGTGPAVQDGGACAGHDLRWDKVISDNPKSLHILLIGLLLFSIFLTLIMNLAEKKTATRKYYRAILMSLYKELVIVGATGFCLFLTEFSGLMSKVVCHPNVLPGGFPRTVFEVSHYLLFFVMLVYVMTVLLCMVVMKLQFRFWTTAEKADRMAVLEDEAQARAILGSRPGLLKKLAAMYRAKKCRGIYAFKALRDRFLFQHDLPADFKFSSYLSKGSRSLLTSLIQVHVFIWVLLIVVTGINLTRMLLEGRSRQGPVRHFAWVSGLGYIVLVLTAASVLKFRAVKKALHQRVASSEAETITAFMATDEVANKVFVNNMKALVHKTEEKLQKAARATIDGDDRHLVDRPGGESSSGAVKSAPVAAAAGAAEPGLSTGSNNSIKPGTNYGRLTMTRIMAGADSDSEEDTPLRAGAGGGGGGVGGQRTLNVAGAPDGQGGGPRSGRPHSRHPGKSLRPAIDPASVADNFDERPEAGSETALMATIMQVNMAVHDEQKRKHLALFWFSSHRFHLALIQAIVFLHSFYFALCAMAIFSVGASLVLHGFGLVILLIPTLFTIPALCFSVVPNFSLATHIEYLYKTDLIAATLDKVAAKRAMDQVQEEITNQILAEEQKDGAIEMTNQPQNVTFL